MLIQLDELFAKENNQVDKVIVSDEPVFQTAVGEFPVLQIQPVRLQLVHTSRKRLQADGSMELVLEMQCARCLKEVPVSFSIQFHKEIDCGNLESEDESDDTQYIVDSALDVGKIFRDEILLQWPAKVLCKEDCKGICKVCGHDLNEGDCGCDRIVLDPRMAAIQDIFKQGNVDKEV